MCVAKKNYFFIVCLMLLLLITCGLSHGEAQVKNQGEASAVITQDLVINTSSTDENKDVTQEEILPTPAYSSLVKPTMPPSSSSKVPKHTMTVTATRIGMTRYFSPGPPAPPHDSPPETPHQVVLPASVPRQPTSSPSVRVQDASHETEENFEDEDNSIELTFNSTNINKPTNRSTLVLRVIPTPTVRTTTIITKPTTATVSDSGAISLTTQTVLEKKSDGNSTLTVDEDDSEEDDKEDWDDSEAGNDDDNDNDNEDEIPEELPNPVPLVSPSVNYVLNNSPNVNNGQLEADFADAFNNSEQNHKTRRKLRNVIGRRRVKKLRGKKLNDTFPYSGFRDNSFFSGQPEPEEERPNSFNQGPYRSTYVPSVQTTTASTTTTRKLPTRTRMTRRFRSTTTTTTADPIFENKLPTPSSFVNRFAITEIPPPSFSSMSPANTIRSTSSSPILLKSQIINYDSRDEDEDNGGRELRNDVSSSNPQPQIERPTSILYSFTEQLSSDSHGPRMVDNLAPTATPSTFSGSLPILTTPSTVSEELRPTSTTVPVTNVHNNETGEWLQSEHSKHHEVPHDELLHYGQGRDQWEKNYMNLQQTSFFNSAPSTEEMSEAPIITTEELLPHHDPEEHFNTTESGGISSGSGSKRSSSRQGLFNHSYNEDPGEAITIIEHHHHHGIPTVPSHHSTSEFYSDDKLSLDHTFAPHLSSKATETNSNNNKIHSSVAPSIFHHDSPAPEHQHQYQPQKSSQGNSHDYFPLEDNLENPYPVTSLGSSTQAFNPYRAFPDAPSPKPGKRSKKKQGSHYDRNQHENKYVSHPYPSANDSPKSAFMDQVIFLDPSPTPTTKRRNNIQTTSLETSGSNYPHSSDTSQLRKNSQSLPSQPPQNHFPPSSHSPFPFSSEFPPAQTGGFMDTRNSPSGQHEASGTNRESNSFNLKSPHATSIEDHFKAMRNSIVFKPTPSLPTPYNSHAPLPPPSSSHSPSLPQSYSHFSSGDIDKYPSNFKKESSRPVAQFHHYYPTESSGNTFSVHETSPGGHSYSPMSNDFSPPFKSMENSGGPKSPPWASGGSSDLIGSAPSLSSSLDPTQYTSTKPRNPKLLKPMKPGVFSSHPNPHASSSPFGKSNPLVGGPTSGYQSTSSGSKYRESSPSKAGDFSGSHASFANYHDQGHPPISSPPSLTLPMPGLVNIPTPPSESHAMNEVTPNRHFPPHSHSMASHSDYEPANPPLPSGHILDQHFDHFVQNAGDFKDEHHSHAPQEQQSSHLPPPPPPTNNRGKSKAKKNQYVDGYNFKDTSSPYNSEASGKHPSSSHNNYNNYKYTNHGAPNGNSLDEGHYYNKSPPPQSLQFYKPKPPGHRDNGLNSIPDYPDIETAGEPFVFDHPPPSPSPPTSLSPHDDFSHGGNNLEHNGNFGGQEYYPQENAYGPSYKDEHEDHRIKNKPEYHEDNKYKHELDMVLQSLKGLKKEQEENSVSPGTGKETEEKQKPEEINPYSETPYVLMFPNMIPPKTATAPALPILPSVPNLSLHKEVPFGSASEHFTPSPELGPGLKAVAVHPRLQMMKVLAAKQYLSELEALQEKQRKPTTIYTPYGVLVPIGLSSSSNLQGSVIPPPKLKLSTSHSQHSHAFAEAQAQSLHPYHSHSHALKGDFDHYQPHHHHHHFPTDEKSLLNILLGAKAHHAHKEVKEVKGKLKGGFRAAVDPALDLLAEKLAIKLSALQYIITHPPKSLEFHISSQPLSALYVNPEASYSELKPVSTSPATKDRNKDGSDPDSHIAGSTHNKAKSMFASMTVVKQKANPANLTSNSDPHSSGKDPSPKLSSPVFSKYLKSLLKDRLFEMLEESYQEKTSNLALTTRKQTSTPTSSVPDFQSFLFTKRDENKKSAQSSTASKKGRQHPFALPSRIVTTRASIKLSRKLQDHHQQSQQQQQHRSHLPQQGGFLNAIKRLFSFGSGRQENVNTNYRKHSNGTGDDIKSRMKNRGDFVNRRPVKQFPQSLAKPTKDELEKLLPTRKENPSLFTKYGFKSAAEMEKTLRYLLKLKPLQSKDETQSSSEKEYHSSTSHLRQEPHNQQQQQQQQQHHPNHYSHPNVYSNTQQQQPLRFLPTTTNFDEPQWLPDHTFPINDLSTSSTRTQPMAMKIIPSPQLAPSNFYPIQSASKETSKRHDNLSALDSAYPANFLPMLNSWKPIPASISFTNDVSSETSATNTDSFQSRSFSVDSTNATATKQSDTLPQGESAVDLTATGQHRIQPRSL